MGNGDAAGSRSPLYGRDASLVVYKLLDAQETVSDGAWVNIRGAFSVLVVADGVGASDGFTLFTHVPTNFGPDETAPSDADDHQALASEVTADGLTSFQRHELGAYIKAAKTTATTGDPTTVLAYVTFLTPK
jgi:hypothetical protein